MFSQSSSNILVKFRQPAIFEPDDIGKSCIPQKKSLNRGRWKFVQGFLLRYITHSYVIWLKNGRLSKFDENIGIWIWSVSFFIVGLHMHTIPQNKDEFTINNLFHCCEALIFTQPLVYEFLCSLIFMAHPVYKRRMKLAFSFSTNLKNSKRLVNIF